MEEALKEVRLKEEERKRLVSEGEIRAFREGDTRKLRKADVENLRAELSGGEVVDLGDVKEELVFEDDVEVVEDTGMATQEIGDVDTVAKAPKHPYTQALFSAALPSHPDERREEIILAGEVPSPLAPPAGCRFHPRCPQAMARCSAEEPKLLPESGRDVACHLYTGVTVAWRSSPSAAGR